MFAPTRLLVAGPLLALCSGCARSAPDVIVVVVDTLRADRLPMYGNDRDTAPHLAAWAAKSVLYERCWSPSSWTAPATASLFTGVYPSQHGVTEGIHAYEELTRAGSAVVLDRIPAGLATLPELLHGLGYATFGVTDNPNISERQGFARGFDRFANSSDAGADAVNQTLLSWRDEIAGKRPSFVYLHYMDPHAPYRARAPWFEPAHSAWQHDKDLARYDSEISFVDAHIGAALEALGAGDDTLVIFTADHGEEFRDHGGREHGFKLYSELTHVPLIVHLPGAAAGRRIAQNVSLIDLLPTLRAALGAPPAAQDVGISLLPSLADGAPLPERPIFSMRRRERVERALDKNAVVFASYKLIRTTPSGLDELYDLAADPRERKNLSAEQPEMTAKLWQLWLDFAATALVPQAEDVEVQLSQAEREALRGLGYAGDGDPK